MKCFNCEDSQALGFTRVQWDFAARRACCESGFDGRKQSV